VSMLSERDAALLEVQRQVKMYCITPLMVFLHGETGIVRDTYQSIAQFTQAGGIVINAWPIIYDPNQRELDRAGVYERCDRLAWTPMKDWIDAGIEFSAIDTLRSTAVIYNSDDVALEHKIRYKQRATRFADTDLHIVLGLTKRE